MPNVSSDKIHIHIYIYTYRVCVLFWNTKQSNHSGWVVVGESRSGDRHRSQSYSRGLTFVNLECGSPSRMQSWPPWLWNMSSRLVGGFKYFLCSPLFGEDSQLSNIFQVGWNHHLVREFYINLHLPRLLAGSHTHGISNKVEDRERTVAKSAENLPKKTWGKYTKESTRPDHRYS